MLGEDHAARNSAHLVRSAPDALQARRDRRRRLDLDHQIHRAHVDAQFEGAGGDDGRQEAALQAVFHLLPLLARDAPVVRRRDLAAGQIVERAREPLGEPPRIDEDHRRAVLFDQLQKPRMDRRPDAAPLRPPCRWPRGQLVAHAPACGLRPSGGEAALLQLPEARHVVDRDFDAHLHLLLRPRVDDGHRPRLPLLSGDLSAAEQPRHLVERPLRRREPDALQRRPRLRLQSLQRKEEVRSPLGRDQRVDLVDDDRRNRAQDLSRLRGEEQVERLGRGNEDVGRGPGHLRPLARRGVARADSDGRDMQRAALRPDARQGRAQVALDVDRQRLERRDVQNPTARLLVGRGSEHQTVDGRQKGSKRLPRAGGREQQGGLSSEDRGPAERLGACGANKRGLEPAPYRLMESGRWLLQRIRSPGIQRMLRANHAS